MARRSAWQCVWHLRCALMHACPSALAQEEGGEFPAETFAAPPALAAVGESWDDKFAAAAPAFDATAPVAGQWSEAATPGWDAAAPPVAPPIDYSAGGVDFAAAYQPR